MGLYSVICSKMMLFVILTLVFLQSCSSNTFPERKVEKLLYALKHGDTEERKKAIESLQKLDATAIESLIAHLNDVEFLDKNNRDCGSVALFVEWTLVRMGRVAVEPLIAALKNKDPLIREGAATTLGELKDSRAVQPLLDVMKSDNSPKVCEAAAFALAELGDPSAIQSLNLQLKDKDWNIQRNAAIALSKMKPSAAVQKFILMLNDKDKHSLVRVYAIDALGNTGDPRAVEPLVSILKKERDYACLGHVIDALGKIGAPAVEPLLSILNDKKNDEGLRGHAALTLGKTRDPRVVEPLIAILSDKTEVHWVRCKAAHALGDAKDARAVEPLIAVLKDETFQWHSGVAHALGEIGDARAIEPLVALYQDEKADEEDRREVVMALGKIKDPRAVVVLTTALKDRDATVRGKAAYALRERKDLRSVEPLIDALSALKSDPKYFVGGGQDYQTRMTIAELLSAMNDARAEKALLAALKEKDLPVVAGARSFFIERGNPEAEGILLEALNRAIKDSAYSKVADDCLYCGNERLMSAARKVAKQYGWPIGNTIRPPVWGSKR